jgi:FlaA1/EpsC-like NDP-sugar epimerase
VNRELWVLAVGPRQTGLYGMVIIDDVRNEKMMEEMIRDADYVYHLAASVGVRSVWRGDP